MARPASSADVFRAVGDPTRRRIIELLHERPRSAGEIAASFSSCHSTVSEHLAILRRAAVVTYTEKEGRRIYELTPAPLEELAAWAAAWTGTSSERAERGGGR
jgi:DNA-binding transcriptional ArsR family regulator